MGYYHLGICQGGRQKPMGEVEGRSSGNLSKVARCGQQKRKREGTEDVELEKKRQRDAGKKHYDTPIKGSCIPCVLCKNDSDHKKLSTIQKMKNHIVKAHKRPRFTAHNIAKQILWIPTVEFEREVSTSVFLYHKLSSQHCLEYYSTSNNDKNNNTDMHNNIYY